MGLGRVKTFALFSNVEFLTQFSEFGHRELLWRSVGDGTKGSGRDPAGWAAHEQVQQNLGAVARLFDHLVGE
jgi:hypothetical protein